MSVVGEVGRLCNNIIRSVAVSVIAEKHDLKTIHFNEEKMKRLGIPLFSGSKEYSHSIDLYDTVYEDVFAMEKIESNLNLNTPHSSFLQTHKIATRVHKYINSKKDSIIEKNPFKDRYNNNNDAYVHIRLTDAEAFNPGIDYYLKVLSMIQFDKLYVSSDNPDHEMITRILMEYPDSSSIIKYEPEETIQFASTCKNIVLSHGTFSAMIGYFSFYSNVYFSGYDRSVVRWCGDVFYMDGWNVV
jgi:hypothetical protein